MGERGPATGTLTLRLYAEDSARIARLGELWGHDAAADVVRHALEMADDMTKGRKAQKGRE